MFRNSTKTAVLLAALGGVSVLELEAAPKRVPMNMFRTHPTTDERVARLRGAHV